MAKTFSDKIHEFVKLNSCIGFISDYCPDNQNSDCSLIIRDDLNYLSFLTFPNGLHLEISKSTREVSSTRYFIVDDYSNEYVEMVSMRAYTALHGKTE